MSTPTPEVKEQKGNKPLSWQKKKELKQIEFQKIKEFFSKLKYFSLIPRKENKLVVEALYCAGEHWYNDGDSTSSQEINNIMIDYCWAIVGKE